MASRRIWWTALKPTTRTLILIAVALITAGYLVAAVGGNGLLPTGVAEPEDTPQAEPAAEGVIRVDDLPLEARETLALINSNGPFPYSKDGSVFHNYERLLPLEKDGYYREYTVATPGGSDRGARRIVTGLGGERYYTDDHYSTFRLIVE